MRLFLGIVEARKQGPNKLPENYRPMPVKETVAVWLDEDVVAYYRSGGLDA